MDRSVYQRLDQLEGQHWWFVARRKIIASAINRFAPRKKNLRVLEAGCGTGGNLAMLSRFGQLEAFELDAEARSIAQAKMPINVKSGMLPDQIPYRAGSFDVVTAFDVIEHVEQDVESLHSLGERLAPGGRLIMTVPALPWLWSKHDETHHHFRRYTKTSLNEALRKAGLEPVNVSYFNSLLFPLIAGLRLARKQLGLAESADDAMPGRFTNFMLKLVFGAEAGFATRIPLPVGVSLMAVAQRRRR
ncbi:class I SAM-dependent methyltransferase [Aestuariivirga litoralis]|uniref:class I SAM-dependent methyltransferase n=1 Tax=Aestuariivirga litoralis TaxID=2650924 RepID=UPI0018C4FED6|nr:class I SAM-dependent methyltransferase [Aestuariivirga litoralis]MBG1232197.1 class I SAM-dependent methyltransferase [Aestuariivirga litoralis]